MIGSKLLKKVSGDFVWKTLLKILWLLSLVPSLYPSAFSFQLLPNCEAKINSYPLKTCWMRKPVARFTFAWPTHPPQPIFLSKKDRDVERTGPPFWAYTVCPKIMIQTLLLHWCEIQFNCVADVKVGHIHGELIVL